MAERHCKKRATGSSKAVIRWLVNVCQWADREHKKAGRGGSVWSRWKAGPDVALLKVCWESTLVVQCFGDSESKILGLVQEGVKT
eukprot:5296897-Ditylum_brightwellii.AAC.1